MTGFRFLPLLPLSVALAGSCLVAMLPSAWVDGIRRRWGAVLILALCGMALGAAASAGVAPWQSRAVPMMAAGEPLAFAWDVHALRFGVLLLGLYVAVGLAHLAEPLGRIEACALLAVVGASLGFVASANLWTCSLLWGLSDLAITGLRAAQRASESGRRVMWSTWGGLLSTGLMVAGAAVLSSQGESTAFAGLADHPLATRLLLGAAVTRLVISPILGDIRTEWETYLVSIWTGAALWMRVVSQSPFGAASGAGVAAGSAALMVSALVASLMPDMVTALPHVVLHSLAIAIVAPVVSPQFGTVAAVMAVFHLTLVMALFGAYSTPRLRTAPRRWAGVPIVWCVASLIGLPLTIGFVTRWAFLRACVEARSTPLAFWGSLSCLLVTVPGWHTLADLPWGAEPSKAPRRWAQWAAAAGTALLFGALVIGGVTPGLVGRLWSRSPALREASSWRGLFTGEWQVIGTSLYIALLGPLVGGYCVHRWVSHASPAARRLLRALRGIFIFDWLVLLLEEVLTRTQNVADRALHMLEEHLYLGWSLLWLMAMVFFLVESQA